MLENGVVTILKLFHERNRLESFILLLFTILKSDVALTQLSLILIPLSALHSY